MLVFRPEGAFTLRFGPWAPGAPRCVEHHFHVHRSARDTYGFADSFFSVRGDVVFADHYQAHVFTEVMRARRPPETRNELRASELHAMGLIHEIFHAVVGLYRTSVRPQVFTSMLEQLARAYGADDLERTLATFIDRFPPPAVYRGELTAAQFLARSTDGVSNREWALEEMILLWVSNQNPGYAPINELIADGELRASTRYASIIESAHRIFSEDAPKFGPDHQDLIEMLLAPVRHAPGSLSGQLEYIRARWGVELARTGAWMKMLGGLDFIREEGLWFERKSHGTGGEDALVPQTFSGEYYESEPEQFSQDLDWMPRVVMIAKSTFVWLDQLSRKYQRPIRQLSDIPEDELATLSRRGITALWLIGLWRRSVASERIKQIQGNKDAIASAYSLYDYEIAPELGGDGAYRELRDRAQRHGIRLASDMVPNHMGIDSRWVIEHPERFVQSGHPPFPNYTFEGPNLSSDDRVGLFLESGYWRRSDAAVVFKRVDWRSGEVRYIYHGNDGTSMPWNDTAQLDYLRADVREAVMQTILHVARKFPIIRFDAAMTLAKKHYQRLWFPLPGTGGAIPSRAEHAMTRERFDELFPNEFWREVVDRVAAEAPNTLLLAEAFWLMEGYFVRTLGMHRVYNSAFMNMLKREDNAGYRLSMKNVLEFNPQILKRHVNFMNNPDEEPAIAQFGKDDKYFGVCTLLSTMPGLPMFGHGQVEGFHEKYGMEFMRATMNEEPDRWLVERHEREIFPLLRKRYLFSEVESFLLYDFFAPEGHVDEDVFAYSNRHGNERALVVYHNKYKQARGWLKSSVGFLADGRIVQRALGDGLGLGRGADRFLVMTEHVSGLEYLRPVDRLWDEGLFLELRAFEYRVFWNLREVVDSAELPFAELERELAGGGVPSVIDAALDLRLRAVHRPFYEAINPGSAAHLAGGGAAAEKELLLKMQHLIEGLAYMLKRVPQSTDMLLAALRGRWKEGLERAVEPGWLPDLDGVPRAQLWITWLYARALAEVRVVFEEDATRTGGVAGIADWRLERVVERALREGGAGDVAERAAPMLTALLRASMRRPLDLAAEPEAAMRALLADPDVRRYLDVHPWDGELWFNKERFESFAGLVAFLSAVEQGVDGARHRAAASRLVERAEESEYKLLALERALDTPPPERGPPLARR